MTLGNPMQYLIDVNLANALIEYLSTKPFRETHAFIGALQSLPPAAAPTPAASSEG